MKIPLIWGAGSNSWDAVISRKGASVQAGKRGGNTDPAEPIFTFRFSNGREPQCVFYPLNQSGSTTLWGQGLPEDTWWHLALVNDTSRTTMYIEGCSDRRRRQTRSPPWDHPAELPWSLGGYDYAGSINQIF